MSLSSFGQALGLVGSVLDAPGALLRSGLALPAHGVRQLVWGESSPKLFSSGRDLLEAYGAPPNDDNIDLADVAGVGIDMLADPISILAAFKAKKLAGLKKAWKAKDLDLERLNRQDVDEFLLRKFGSPTRAEAPAVHSVSPPGEVDISLLPSVYAREGAAEEIADRFAWALKEGKNARRVVSDYVQHRLLRSGTPEEAAAATDAILGTTRSEAPVLEPLERLFGTSKLYSMAQLKKVRPAGLKRFEDVASAASGAVLLDDPRRALFFPENIHPKLSTAEAIAEQVAKQGGEDPLGLREKWSQLLDLQSFSDPASGMEYLRRRKAFADAAKKSSKRDELLAMLKRNERSKDEVVEGVVRDVIDEGERGWKGTGPQNRLPMREYQMREIDRIIAPTSGLRGLQAQPDLVHTLFPALDLEEQVYRTGYHELLHLLQLSDQGSYLNMGIPQAIGKDAYTAAYANYLENLLPERRMRTLFGMERPRATSYDVIDEAKKQIAIAEKHPNPQNPVNRPIREGVTTALVQRIKPRNIKLLLDAREGKLSVSEQKDLVLEMLADLKGGKSPNKKITVRSEATGEAPPSALENPEAMLDWILRNGSGRERIEKIIPGQSYSIENPRKALDWMWRGVVQENLPGQVAMAQGNRPVLFNYPIDLSESPVPRPRPPQPRMTTKDKILAALLGTYKAGEQFKYMDSDLQNSP